MPFKKLSLIFPSILILFIMLVFLSSPAHYAESISKGISLWAVSVMPATFPFLFLTALLTGQRPYAAFSKKISPLAAKLFRLSGNGASVCILAALSGYPVGARMTYDFYLQNRIPKEETFRLACICTTSGPMFLVGTVGCLMFHSAKAGWIMLLSHLLSAFAVGFLLRFRAKPITSAQSALPAPASNKMSDSLWNAVVSILCVGGFIALFYCFQEMLSDLGVFRFLTFGSPYAEGAFRGLLEMTTGCAFLSNLHTPLAVALSCALVTFGGLCVLCQQAAFLSKTNVRFGRFLLVKFLQALLSFCICFPLALLVCV